MLMEVASATESSDLAYGNILHSLFSFSACVLSPQKKTSVVHPFGAKVHPTYWT